MTFQNGNKACLGRKLSDETKRRIGDANKISLKGKHRPEAVKRKISEASKHNEFAFKKGNKLRLGTHLSDKTKLKISNACMGRKLSDKQKQLLSQINKGNKHHFGKHHTEQTKLNISQKKKGTPAWNKGKVGIYSEETKRKISESLKAIGARPPITIRYGKDHHNFGKHLSESTIKKIKEARKIQVIGKGENAPYWRGGKKLMNARARHKHRGRGFILLVKKNPYTEPTEFHHIHSQLPFVVYCPTRIHKMFNGHEKSHCQNVNTMLGIGFDFEQLRDELLRLNKKATLDTPFYINRLEPLK